MLFDRHFLLVVRRNNVIILHRFRDIMTSTVFVTACDLARSLAFDTSLNII